MRVKLSLAACRKATRLPLSYNYAFASLVYKTLGRDSQEFAGRLHDEGLTGEGRKFNLFTFSRLAPRRSRVVGTKLVLDDPLVTLQLSSPVSEFVEHFVAGLLQSETFMINRSEFSLVEAETLPAPIFTERMRFRAISPITETVGEGGSKHPRFLSPGDDWSQIMRTNLVRKYQALHGSPPRDDRLKWEWDKEYIRQYEKRGQLTSILVDVNGSKVRGWMAPFRVEGSVALIALGYKTGYGSRNSMGFGMAESL